MMLGLDQNIHIHFNHLMHWINWYINKRSTSECYHYQWQCFILMRLEAHSVQYAEHCCKNTNYDEI